MSNDREQINEVLIRYATAIDRKDWSLFKTCWVKDAVADYGQLGHFTDVDALTDVFSAVHDGMGPTYHRMSNFVIDVEGDRARVRSYFHAVLMLVPGDTANWIDAVGHYDDVFVRTAEGWRIESRAASTARTLTGGELAAAATSQIASR